MLPVCGTYAPVHCTRISSPTRAFSAVRSAPLYNVLAFIMRTRHNRIRSLRSSGRYQEVPGPREAEDRENRQNPSDTKDRGFLFFFSRTVFFFSFFVCFLHSRARSLSSVSETVSVCCPPLLYTHGRTRLFIVYKLKLLIFFSPCPD